MMAALLPYHDMLISTSNMYVMYICITFVWYDTVSIYVALCYGWPGSGANFY